MSSKEFTAKTFKWLYQVNWDADLLPVDVKVAVQLTRHFNEDDEDGRAFPGCKYVGDKIGVSEPTVIRSVRRLHKRGHLRVIWGAAGRHHSNQYWMVEKTSAAKPLPTSKKPSRVKVFEERKPTSVNGKPTSGANKTYTAVKENHKENYLGNQRARAAPHLGRKKVRPAEAVALVGNSRQPTSRRLKQPPSNGSAWSIPDLVKSALPSASSSRRLSGLQQSRSSKGLGVTQPSARPTSVPEMKRASRWVRFDG